MRVLLTGGTGFIGSHTAVALIEAGHEPVLLDNPSNCRSDVIDRLYKITGRKLPFFLVDVKDTSAVRSVLEDEGIETVMHFAALKAVAESVAQPLAYHVNNVGGMLSLLEAMDASAIRSFVFSSSATVYGEPQYLPIDENHPTSTINPYGRTKLVCEQILTDLAQADAGWRVSLLRYFNPVGAHSSGLIGEDPTAVPNNLMPLVTRVATGQMDKLSVFGTNYSTADGSAVRDYLHVVDLAEGHVAALRALGLGAALQTYNLGTGKGTSVLEIIAAFEAATGVAVPFEAVERRVGDAAEVFASADRAGEELGWKARRSITEMCADSLCFAVGERKGNPDASRCEPR